MSTLDVTRSYSDLSLLSASNLDDFLDDIETFFNTPQVTNSNFADGGITANTKLTELTVTAGVIAASAVDTAALGTGSCTLAKFTDASISTDKIAASNITGAKVASGTLTTVKIQDAAITTAKITDANVTVGKLASANVQVSSTSTGVFTTTSTSFTDVTNCSVSITTTGGPIFVGIIPDGDSSNAACVGHTPSGSSEDTGAEFQLDLDSATQLKRFPSQLRLIGATSVSLLSPPGIIRGIFTGVAAGSHTIKLRCAAVSSAPSTVTVKYCKIVAWEMT